MRVLAETIALRELGEEEPGRSAIEHLLGPRLVAGADGETVVAEASRLEMRRLGSLRLPLAAPLVDGLLGEHPLSLDPARRDAPLGRPPRQRFGVHRQIDRR